MRDHEHMHIRRTLTGPSPRIDYKKIAAHILGEHYNLSVTVCGDRLARRINTEHRKKTYSPNVLSFPYDTNSGEIFLNVRKAEREAHNFSSILKSGRDRTVAEHVVYLYIHGCLHLKGHNHGTKMDTLEEKYVHLFAQS